MATKAHEYPERLDLGEHRGDLIASEHVARYMWATQLAAGRRILDAGCGTGYGLALMELAGASEVVGIDVSPTAVEAASRRGRPGRVRTLEGSVEALPFADGEFDLIVCFEVIEHVVDRERTLNEFARVLDPEGGVLCISTPNNRVYQVGNPHHVYEYAPEEFQRTLCDRFAHVCLYRQTAWLASAILSDEQAVDVSGQELGARIVKSESRAAGEETFTLALAGQRDLTAAGSLLALGSPFEVRWWEREIERVADERDAERTRRESYGQSLLELETELANARNEVSAARQLQEELCTWGEEREREVRTTELTTRDFETRLRRAEQTLHEVTTSLSWRITTPLRSGKQIFKGH